MVAGWVAGGVVLAAVLVRVSSGVAMNSDAANNALQAWDMWHGNVLLHGWIIGDATYYTFELPVYGVAEAVLGLGAAVTHVVAAVVYVVVAGFGVWLAAGGCRGVAAAARAGVVVAVLGAPLVSGGGVATLLEAPDHIGTAAIMLGSFVLIDRAAGRWFTGPLLAVVLAAGQLGDATVRYVGVPAVLAVCGWRMLAARRLAVPDAVLAAAAVVSVPAAVAAQAGLVAVGGYAMVPPGTGVAAARLWPGHAVLAARAAGSLFGAVPPGPGVGPAGPGGALGTAAALFGAACALAAAAGFARVVRTWRSAARGEQLACAAITVNLAVYTISAIPSASNAREIAAVLPCGAVLAARALVPARLTAPRARIALAAAALAALAPLAMAVAARPPARPAIAPLAAWLQAHHLRYGLAGYWDASATTVQSGNQVQVRAIGSGPRYTAGGWEADTSWYNAARYDATFVIADLPHTYFRDNRGPASFERYFGKPTAIYRVDGRIILVYRTNLLDRIALPPSPAG